jgi:hypothetical protein
MSAREAGGHVDALDLNRFAKARLGLVQQTRWGIACALLYSHTVRLSHATKSTFPLKKQIEFICVVEVW